MNNLIKRTITGAVFVSLVVGSILFQDRFNTFTALFALFNVMSMVEFYRIVNKKQNVKVPSVYMIICGTILYFGMFLCAKYDNPDKITGFLLLILYMLCIVFVIIREVYKNNEHPTYNLAFAIYGQVVVALPFGLLNFIARNPMDLLAMFILLWSFDTGAYLFGCSLGKHKMIPKISPKKSWEGEIGGALTAIAIGIGIALYLSAPIIEWVIYAIIIVIFGTYGDLSESMLKRASGLKDSGSILPGHGGMLDRFDSMLLAAPMIYIYLEILKAIH